MARSSTSGPTCGRACTRSTHWWLFARMNGRTIWLNAASQPSMSCGQPRRDGTTRRAGTIRTRDTLTVARSTTRATSSKRPDPVPAPLDRVFRGGGTDLSLSPAPVAAEGRRLHRSATRPRHCGQAAGCGLTSSGSVRLTCPLRPRTDLRTGREVQHGHRRWRGRDAL